MHEANLPAMKTCYWTLFCVRFHLTAEYVYQVLKMDLNYVSSSKIVNNGVEHERKDILEAVREVLNLMFVYDRTKHTTVLKKEFENELKALVDCLSINASNSNTIRIVSPQIRRPFDDQKITPDQGYSRNQGRESHRQIEARMGHVRTLADLLRAIFIGFRVCIS